MTPIFILGVTHRSGTNFLSNLLGLHPDCVVPRQLHEDWFLSSSALLIEYVNRTAHEWNPDWFDLDLRRRNLCAILGGALVNFALQDNSGCLGKYVVLKTPSTRGIENLFSLFPSARLIVLARNGKDTCESIVKGFGGAYETTFHLWKKSAGRVIDFSEKFSGCRQVFYARYENLYNNLDDEMHRILDFCGLDPQVYNYTYAKNYPIIGSSMEVDSYSRVHWVPVGRAIDFNPTDRSKHWTHELHTLFDEICGIEVERLELISGK